MRRPVAFPPIALAPRRASAGRWPTKPPRASTVRSRLTWRRRTHSRHGFGQVIATQRNREDQAATYRGPGPACGTPVRALARSRSF